MTQLGQRLSGAFAVPTHLLGTAPKPRSRWERGSHELAYAEQFEAAYGVLPPLTDDAEYVRLRRYLHAIGVE